MKILTLWLKALFICSVVFVAGCGFALKGAGKPLLFTVVQLQSQANSWLAGDIAARLASRGVKLSTDAQASVPRIALLDEARDRTVVSTSATGGVRQYQLKHSVTVQVYDGSARTWLEPVTFSQARDVDYNPSQVLAKEIEEQALLKDMQAELVNAVMRRIEATNSIAAPK